MAVLTQESARRAFKVKLGRQGKRMRPSIWKDLVNSRYVDLLLRGRIDLERLVEIYLQKEETYFVPRVARREVVSEVEDDDARARALSEMLARLLCGICGVDAFRAEVLGGKLLSVEQIGPWIQEQAAREGPVTGNYITVPAPVRERHDWLFTCDRSAYAEWLAERGRRVVEDPACELPRGVTQGPLVLEFAVPGRGTGGLAIRGDGLLAQLKTVASGIKGLCGLTGWSEASAVAFVLCGQIPPFRAASVAVRHGAYPAAAQIELTVSANMSVKEVAELYQEVRLDVRGAFERAMDEKHLALALFVDEFRESGLGWKEIHRRWNERHPEWRYETENDPYARRFALEARRTWSRLSGERWRDLRDVPIWLRSPGK